MFFDESVFFVFALISPVVMYFYCHVMFFLTIIHLHVTFTFTHLLDYSRHSTFVMHHLLQRGWYYTIMHPPSTICCLILGLIRLFSWDIPRPRVFSLDISTNSLGIYEDITHALGIYEDNTLRTGYIRG